MRRAERIELAFATLGEAGKPAARPQRVDAMAAARQNFVRVGLVSHVPDEPVARGVEHVVQRHCQLDHAEARAKMAAGHGHGADCFGP